MADKILQEDGTDILLEDGGSLLDESSPDPPEAAVLLPTYNNKKRITNHTNLRR